MPRKMHPRSKHNLTPEKLRELRAGTVDLGGNSDDRFRMRLNAVHARRIDLLEDVMDCLRNIGPAGSQSCRVGRGDSVGDVLGVGYRFAAYELVAHIELETVHGRGGCDARMLAMTDRSRRFPQDRLRVKVSATHPFFSGGPTGVTVREGQDADGCPRRIDVDKVADAVRAACETSAALRKDAAEQDRQEDAAKRVALQLSAIIPARFHGRGNAVKANVLDGEAVFSISLGCLSQAQASAIASDLSKLLKDTEE